MTTKSDANSSDANSDILSTQPLLTQSEVEPYSLQTLSLRVKELERVVDNHSCWNECVKFLLLSHFVTLILLYCVYKHQ